MRQSKRCTVHISQEGKGFVLTLCKYNMHNSKPFSQRWQRWNRIGACALVKVKKIITLMNRTNEGHYEEQDTSLLMVIRNFQHYSFNQKPEYSPPQPCIPSIRSLCFSIICLPASLSIQWPETSNVVWKIKEK